MPRGRRSRRDRRPEYQRHRPQRQNSARATENHQGDDGILDQPRGFMQSAESEFREYATEQGPVLELTDMAPTRPKDRFFSVLPSDGICGVSAEERDIHYALQQMQIYGPGRKIEFRFTYAEDDAVSKAKLDGCPVRITTNHGRRPRDGVDRGFAQDMVEHTLSPPEEHAIRMVRASRPLIAHPEFNAPQTSQPSYLQQHLQPHTPLRQVKKEEPA
ncbi:uncharacterized protein FPRN_09973 [Fusarium proliferatum]|nr:uncharacterized protein FPRN_09973 [Fusarium proliferatum]